MTLNLVNKTYRLKGACGHSASTDVELVLQYPDDKHYFRCPSCRNILEGLDTETPNLRVPTAWTEVCHYGLMPSMSARYAPVMPDDILRLQPSVPPNRQRVKRYATKSRTGPRR